MHVGALIVSVCLLALSAFFVLAEFAVVRVRPTQLEALVAQDTRALVALEIQRRLGYHLSGILVSITVCALGFGAIGEELFVGPFKHLLHYLPWPWLVHPLATALALLVMTTLHVVLTEMLPRSLAISNAGKWALWTARPMLIWSRLIHPLTWTLIQITRLFESLFGIHSDLEHPEDLLPSEEEFKKLLEQSQAKGQLSLSKAELIENLFDFSKRTIKEIAIPRVQVTCLDIHREWSQNLEIARTTPFSRLPLVEGDLDHVIGVVHLKELLWALHEHPSPLDLRSLARPAFFVPEMKPIQELLLAFQQAKQHLALVVNEHGGVDGLVTLEDVLEELVGEIQDEFDRETIQLRQTKGGAWVAQGTVTLEQLEQHLNLNLPVEEGSITLGGYFQETLGRIVRLGDEVRLPSWRIRVLSMRGLAPGRFLIKPVKGE